MDQPIWTWKITQDICCADGAPAVPVYGVCACRDGQVVWGFPDVDTHRYRVEMLLDRLMSARPEPCHWQEIVEDFIAAGVQD